MSEPCFWKKAELLRRSNPRLKKLGLAMKKRNYQSATKKIVLLYIAKEQEPLILILSSIWVGSGRQQVLFLQRPRRKWRQSNHFAIDGNTKVVPSSIISSSKSLTTNSAYKGCQVRLALQTRPPMHIRFTCSPVIITFVSLSFQVITCPNQLHVHRLAPEPPDLDTAHFFLSSLLSTRWSFLLTSYPFDIAKVAASRTHQN